MNGASDHPYGLLEEVRVGRIDRFWIRTTLLFKFQVQIDVGPSVEGKAQAINRMRRPSDIHSVTFLMVTWVAR